MTNNRRATLAKAIKWIATTGEKLTLTIHTTAIGVMEDAQQTGDVTLMVDLYNALHTSQRKRSFTVWLYDFSPIRLKMNDETGLADRKGSGLLKEDSKMFKPWNIQGATDVTYWEYTRESAPTFLKASTLLKIVETATKRLERAEESDLLEPGINVKAVKEMLDEMAAVQAKFERRVMGKVAQLKEAKDSPNASQPRARKPKAIKEDAAA